MRKSILAITLASSLSLAACTTNRSTTGDFATGAAAGGALGAAAGAVVPGVSVIEGAAVGALIGGTTNVYWADANNDGYVDGYTQGQGGTYYAGSPQGYDPTRRVVTTALGGAALGAAAGAVIPGLGILEGAVVGGLVGGIAGAIWADRDQDGRVDGYQTRDGTYYPGAPATTTPTYTPGRAGERG